MTRHCCAFREETLHGYSVVDVISGFCECGAGCVEACPFSYPITMEREVAQVFDKALRVREPDRSVVEAGCSEVDAIRRFLVGDVTEDV